MVLNHQSSVCLHRYIAVRVPVSVLQEDEMVWAFFIILNYSCNKCESHPSFYADVLSTRIAVTTQTAQAHITSGVDAQEQRALPEMQYLVFCHAVV